MSKFRNNKTKKTLGIQTIFGQHSVKAALQNDKSCLLYTSDAADE